MTYYYTEPRDYQRLITPLAIKKKNFGFFDEPGIGKSKLAIDSAVNKFLEGQIDSVTIVCPAGLRYNWVEQIETHCDPKYRHLFEHKDVECLDAMKCGKYALISHEAVSRFAIPYSSKSKLIIIDESHNFKNTNSNRGFILMEWLDQYAGVFSLSGTPRGNNSIDFFVQLKLLGIDITKSNFIKKHCYVIRGRFGIKYSNELRNEELLMDQLASISSWTRKRDVLDIPARQFITLYYETSIAQEKALKALRSSNAKLAVVEEETINKTMHTVAQIYSGFIKNEDGEYKTIACGKLDLLKSLLQSINDKQFIIFINYIYEAKIISDLLNKIKISYNVIHGSSEEPRESVKKDFIAGKFQCLIGMESIVKEGYSFNNATAIIYYSNSPSVLARTQSLERNQRVGQTAHCTVYDLVKKNGYDDYLLQQLNEKNVMQEKLYQMFMEMNK